MSQESVLQRIAAGDPHAVQECMDVYGGLVWSLARRYCRPGAEAEDAVQDVFVDLWKSAARFDPERASEATFVAMVARRRFIDLLRRRERRPQLAPIPDDFDVPIAADAQIETDADAALAARAIAQLKPEQRQVLLLSVYHGMTHSEIGDELGMPLGTVKSHVRRGLAEVRRILAEKNSPRGSGPLSGS